MQKKLGKHWRKIHLLTVPAFILAIAHTVLIGSHYLGDLQLSLDSKLRTVVVVLVGVLILLVRSPLFWTIIGQKKSFVPPKNQ